MTIENIKAIRENQKVLAIDKRVMQTIITRRWNLKLEAKVSLIYHLIGKVYLDFGRKGKLSLRYIGPYEILEFIMSFMCPCCEIPDSSYILQEQHIEIEERLDL